MQLKYSIYLCPKEANSVIKESTEQNTMKFNAKEKPQGLPKMICSVFGLRNKRTLRMMGYTVSTFMTESCVHAREGGEWDFGN